MSGSSDRVRRYRKWFAIGLVVSVLVLVGTAFLLPAYQDYSGVHQQSDDGSGEFPVMASNAPAGTLLTLVSLCTSLVTLAGLILTTLIAWGKDRRERKLADVELEIRRTELARLKREEDLATRADARQSPDAAPRS